MFFHYLKFELTKRNQRWWVWLLVATLTGIGVTGNFQQKAAHSFGVGAGDLHRRL